MIGWGLHFSVSGLSHQVPGTGAQVQIRVQEIRPLSSIQPSPRFGWQVAAPGGRRQDFSIQPSTQSSIQSSVIDSAIDSAIHSAALCRDTVPTLPRQTREARGAAPTPRHALPRYSILHTRYSRSPCHRLSHPLGFCYCYPHEDATPAADPRLSFPFRR